MFPKQHPKFQQHPLDSQTDFQSGQGKGIRLKEMQPYIDLVLGKLVKNAELIGGHHLVSPDGRPVVAVTSHGPGFAWMPVLALVGQYYLQNGLGDVIGGMYPHWAVFLVPGLKKYYERTLGTPTRVNTVDDVVDSLNRGELHITGTAPEGANNLFSFREYVGPFRSKGMISAAIRANAHLVVLAHYGSDPWNLRLNLPFGLSVPQTDGLRGVNLPLPPLKPLDHYLAMCRPYTPSLTAEDMRRMGKRKARLMMHLEIERIRVEMNLMTDELKERLAQKKRRDRMRVFTGDRFREPAPEMG